MLFMLTSMQNNASAISSKILFYMAAEQEIICVEANRGLLEVFTPPPPKKNYKFGHRSGFGI